MKPTLAAHLVLGARDLFYCGLLELWYQGLRGQYGVIMANVTSLARQMTVSSHDSSNI